MFSLGDAHYEYVTWMQIMYQIDDSYINKQHAILGMYVVYPQVVGEMDRVKPRNPK